MNSKKCDSVIIADGIDESGVFEIWMPELGHDELRQVVEYELSKNYRLHPHICRG